MVSERDYPTEAELQTIRDWPLTDPRGLMAFVKSIWWSSDWGWAEKGERYFISTGGWSGNEEIISVLMEKSIFWSMYWTGSHRGGHYEFEIPIHEDEAP